MILLTSLRQWAVIGGQNRNKWCVHLSSLFLCFVLSLFFILSGCGPQRVARTDMDQEKAKPVGLVIEAIGVAGNGDTVLVEASDRIKYTAFRLTDPPRLIIDIPRVNMDMVADFMDVENAYITSITTSGYGEEDRNIGRIEIGLQEGINHEIKIQEGNLVVTLLGDVAYYSLDQESYPDEGEVEEEVLEVEVGEVDEAPADAIEELISPTVTTQENEAETKSAEEEEINVSDLSKFETTAAKDEEILSTPFKDAKKVDIMRVVSERIDKGTLINIITNGAIAEYDSFELSSPPRLVIDVLGAGSLLKNTVIDIGGAHIERIRVGTHSDKTRIVFDKDASVSTGYSIERMNNGLLVKFAEDILDTKMAFIEDEKPHVDEEVIEGVSLKEGGAELGHEEEENDKEVGTVVTEGVLVADAEEAIDLDTSINITGVDFERFDDRAELKITASRRIEYKVYESLDGKTMIIDLSDALISESLERTLDAVGLNTPVSSISSFQAKAGPEGIVRVMIKLDRRAAYDIAQKGNIIYTNFSIQEEAPLQKEIEIVELEEEKEIAPSEKYEGRKISLDFKDADITNILRLIAEVSNLNIISGDDVVGRVSLRLVDVPWDQAFEIILKSKGLGKVQEGNVVRVAPLARIKQEEEALLASMKAKEKLEPLELKLLPISYATAGDLQSKVMNLLTDRGTVTVDERTNILIINDVKSNLDEAVALVKSLDAPTPQVLIETRIVEVQSIFARDMGIQWGVAGLSQTGNDFVSGFGSTSTIPPSSLTPTGFIATGGRFSEQPSFAVDLPAAGSAGTLGALGFSFGKLTGDSSLLDLRISAGEKNGLTKVISRPRIATLDNKEARISQGDSVPFETTSATGTQTQFIDATMELIVTPHITPDGRISMKIFASRNSIGSFRSARGTPSISKKEASTEIIVRDGETAVIGGIVVSDNKDSTSGIPFFKNIPILGWLFKSESIGDTQTELLIFITPTILKDGTLG